MIDQLAVTDSRGHLRWWDIALAATVARLALVPDWIGVVVLALLLLRWAAIRALRHSDKQRLLSDTARLAHLENEVRALNTAVTMRNIGRN